MADTTFQTNGYRSHDIDGTDRAWAGLVVYETAGGVTRIVIAGESGDFGALAAYTATGAIDTTFGTNGVAVPSVPGAFFSTPWGLAVQSDGSLLLGSEYYVSNFQPILMRFTSAGVQDSSFGSGGRVFPAPFSSTELYSYPVYDPVNSRIYFSNWSELSSDDDFNTHAFDTSGNPVNAFSGDGRTSLDIALADPDSQDTSQAITVDSSGRVLVVGAFEPRPSKTFAADFFVVRYTTAGVLDTTFSGDGIFTYDNGADEVARAIKVQSDGKIVVAGKSTGSWLILRLNSDGTLDTSFGTGGAVTAFSGNDNTMANAIDFQSDDKIVVAGTVGNASRDVGVIRLHP